MSVCQNCLVECDEVFPVSGYEACQDCYIKANEKWYMR